MCTANRFIAGKFGGMCACMHTSLQYSDLSLQTILMAATPARRRLSFFTGIAKTCVTPVTVDS